MAKVGELFVKTDEFMKPYEELFKKTDTASLNLEEADLAMKEALGAGMVGIEQEVKAGVTLAPGGVPPGIERHHQSAISNVQERIVLAEREIVKLQSGMGEHDRSFNVMGTRFAAVEAAAGDGWAKSAEERRQ